MGYIRLRRVAKATSFHSDAVRSLRSVFAFAVRSHAPFANSHLRCFPLLRSSFCSWSGAPFVGLRRQIFVQARNLPIWRHGWLQFTRTFLWADFMLAWKSACMNVRRERQEMSKNELQSSGEPRSGGFANGAEWTVTFMPRAVFIFLSIPYSPRTWKA